MRRYAGAYRPSDSACHATAYRDDEAARCTIPVGILPGPGSGEHLPNGCQDLAGPGAGQHVRAHLDRLRPFGILPEGDAGHPQDAGLLLDPPGVGQDKASAGFEL